ncbi:MAG TPA: ATP-binding cassette domain-containing protein [Mycobacteriales bacterium]|jgi:osmoprotectant transport system ATP-binding protein|nr:ATP-binding cassette domain-containing protein [Mycobacteriales bacterium]
MITFEHVTKRFPDGTVAVEDLDLVCPTGQITVFVGPSGCGKTTSLRMINRLVEPTSGRILVDGEDVRLRDAAELRRGMGYVIQQAGLFPHRTVVDNVATVPMLLGVGRREARLRAAELLERVGLPAALGTRYPYQLSGGQQQRVGVARALAADPPIMLMDEPFSAVDPVVRGELQQEFLRLQDDIGKTIVFVTHDVDEAVKLGDQIAVFATGGHLVQVDTPEHLLAAPADDFVAGFLGGDRGIRRLTFLASDRVGLDCSDVVERSAPDRARESLREAGRDWALLVDAERCPEAWVRTQPGGETRPVERTFNPAADSLRVALDSALLSPAGRAVGVDDDGRVLGTAAHADILRAVTDEVARTNLGRTGSPRAEVAS